MKFLLIIEPPKICITGVALIIAVVILFEILLFFRHCIAFSIVRGRSDILFLERLHSHLGLLRKSVTPMV
jgi:hypothetical protein